MSLNCMEEVMGHVTTEFPITVSHYEHGNLVRQYEKEVTLEQFAHAMEDWLNKDGFTGDWERRFDEDMLIAFHRILVPELPMLNASVQGYLKFNTNVQSQHSGVSWRIVTFTARIVEWLFFRRDDPMKPWRWVPLPQTCSVDEDGTITVNYRNREFTFKKNAEFGPRDNEAFPWPDVINETEHYVLLSELAALLKNDKENQITALINSEQPYKLIGYQLKRKLEALWEVMA